jgi:hypothetical protein
MISNARSTEIADDLNRLDGVDTAETTAIHDLS